MARKQQEVREKVGLQTSRCYKNNPRVSRRMG
jgi:hypothetical protein